MPGTEQFAVCVAFEPDTQTGGNELPRLRAVSDDTRLLAAALRECGVPAESCFGSEFDSSRVEPFLAAHCRGVRELLVYVAGDLTASGDDAFIGGGANHLSFRKLVDSVSVAAPDASVCIIVDAPRRRADLNTPPAEWKEETFREILRSQSKSSRPEILLILGACAGKASWTDADRTPSGILARALRDAIQERSGGFRFADLARSAVPATRQLSLVRCTPDIQEPVELHQPAQRAPVIAVAPEPSTRRWVLAAAILLVVTAVSLYFAVSRRSSAPPTTPSEVVSDAPAPKPPDRGASPPATPERGASRAEPDTKRARAKEEGDHRGSVTSEKAKEEVKPGIPELSIEADVRQVSAGEPVTVSWNARNVSGPRLNGETSAAFGSKTEQLFETKTYTLSGTAYDGSPVSKAVTVRVQKPAVIQSFTASPAVIALDETLRLSWSVEHADEIRLKLTGKPSESRAELDEVVREGRGTRTVVIDSGHYTRYGIYRFQLTAAGGSKVDQKSVEITVDRSARTSGARAAPAQ